MKHKLLNKLLTLTLFILGGGTFSPAWGDSYTITFGNNANSATSITSSTNASTVISNGTTYVTSKPFTINNGNCYYGDTKTCIRIGKSGNASSLFIALSDNGKVKATSIVVNCNNTGGNKNSNAKLNVNSIGQQTTSETASDYTFTYTNATDITSITLEGTASIKIYSITVNYSTPPTTYSVTYNSNGGSGDMTDSNSPYEAGAEVTLLSNTFTAPTGKTWSSWAVTDGSSNPVTVTDGKFTMPSSNVTVTAQWVDAPASDYITASPTTTNIDAAGGVAEFTITTDQTLDVNPTQFYTTSEGNETTSKPTWITDVHYDDGTLLLTVAENTGVARTAYFRVEKGSVKSDVITISQAGVPVETPSFSPVAGIYTSAQSVTISSETEEATIYYTTNGDTPTTSSTPYSSAINVGETMTIKAIAVKEGYTNSAVAEAAYTINIPVVDYVTLPFAFDKGKTDIGSTTGLTQSGLGSDYSSSPKLKFDGTGDYVILKIGEAPGKLTFDIKGNSFSGGTFKVQTSVDGNTYTDLKSYTSLSDTKSEEFTNLDANVRYIKWIYTNKSSGNVALGNISLTKAPPATPTFSVEEGEYSEAKSVEISCATDGATIYYTTNGDTPTSSSTTYSSAIPITETTTLKAIAIKDEVESAVASATYTMNRPAAPKFDKPEGVFDAAFDLHLSTETDDATIYYTTDESTPTISSTEYSTKIAISSTTTVKAIAVKDGLTSDVASATYTYDLRTTPTFTLSNTNLNLKVNDTSDAVTLTTNSDGDISFSCNDAHVTLIGTGNSRTISANAAGEYTVNVSISGSATYKDAAGTITVTVTKKATTMVLTPSFTSKDLYVTTTGSITGVPQYNSSDIDGAEVTYSSSDTKVATIDTEGAITFKKAGSTTITVSYAGNDEYKDCEASYNLDLTDSSPQATKVDITLNNTFFGCESFTNWTTGMATTLSESHKNITITYSKGASSHMYCSTKNVRFYTDNTFTIVAPAGYNIISVDMNVSISSADPEGAISSDTWIGDANSVSFTFANKTDISSITVTIAPIVIVSAAGYATYASDHALDFTNSNIKAYIAKAKNDGSGVTFERVYKIPAETGVLLYKDGGTTEAIPVFDPDKEDADKTNGNVFVRGEGVAVASVVGNMYNYILNIVDNVVGFYKAAGNKVAKNRAYIQVKSASLAKDFISMPGFDDSTTGVTEVNGSGLMINGPVYDLQGRRVEKPGKGLYIVNGKKVLKY